MTGRPADYPRPPHVCKTHPPGRICYDRCRCRCSDCSRIATARRKRQALGITRRVPVIGAQRRLQALAALGWTGQMVADAAGMHTRSLDYLRAGAVPAINRATAARIAEVYDRLSMSLPPDSKGVRAARSHARRRGWVPPLAWDEGAIDDPDAIPHTQPGRRDGATVEDIEWCIEGGETSVLAIAQRVHIAAASVKRMLDAAGRGDLIARLDDDPMQVHGRNRYTGRAA